MLSDTIAKPVKIYHCVWALELSSQLNELYIHVYVLID